MAVRFDKARVLARARAGVTNALLRCAVALERNAKTRISAGGGKVRHAAPGAPPLLQTGALRASITHAQVGSEPRFVIGPTIKYGKVQEFGTVGKGGKLPDIRPKSGRFLAVAVHKDAYGKSPRMFGKDLVLVKRPGKPALLVRVQKTVRSKDGSSRVQRIRRNDIMYILLAKVAVAPHPFMRPSLAAIQPMLQRELKGCIKP